MTLTDNAVDLQDDATYTQRIPWLIISVDVDRVVARLIEKFEVFELRLELSTHHRSSIFMG
jgi:hypothetical protein